MPRIQFPSVPQLPGVPQLLRRAPAGPPPALASSVGLASLIRAFTSQNQWGIFAHIDSGTTTAPDGITTVTVTAKRVPAVTPDSFLWFDYNQEDLVSTAPTQQGAFADYNRVATPFEIQLRMTKGGSVADRAFFLNQIASLDTTKLYDILTPEKTYLRVNITRFSLSRRGEKGAYWFEMADVYFREIREVTATYTKTVIANPTSASAAQQQNNGTQQGIPSTATLPPSVTR